MIKVFDYFPKNENVTGHHEQGCEEQENERSSGKNMKGTFFSHSVLPDFRKSIAFWNVARLRSFVTLVTSACRW
jgi:hypothetical protein